MASVYKKSKTWYIRFKDDAGEWRAKASQAQTKTEAKRLALEATAKAKKESWGFLDTRQSQDGHQSLEAMLRWWLETYSQGTPSQSIDHCFVAKHFFGTSFAALPLAGVTSSAIEKFLQSKSQALGPSSINHLRSYLSRAINKGIKAGLFFGANPIAVQRILRHSDAKITTEVYGHLSPGYLRAESDKLSSNPPEADPSEE